MSCAKANKFYSIINAAREQLTTFSMDGKVCVHHLPIVAADKLVISLILALYIENLVPVSLH